jgi:hypothetical protein
MAIITSSTTRLSKAISKADKETITGTDKGNVSKIIRTFNTYLDSYEDNFQEEEVDPKRYFFLRPSSFPYCGFKKLLSAPTDIDAPRLNTFASTYFTQIGHATHEVFQLFGGRGGKFVGDWVCNTCGNISKFTTDNMCECGCPKGMSYLELEIRYRGIILGHIDGLFRLDPKKGNKSAHVLVDYKTTSSKNVKLPAKSSPFPYKYNVAQIEAYVPLIEEQYGVNIDYWLLAYLARDAPFKYGRVLRAKYLSVNDKAAILKKLDRWVKTHKLVLTASTTEEFERIDKRKLCKSAQDYKDNYKEEYNVCPYVKDCFTKPETLIKKALKHKIFPIIDHAPKKVQRSLREIIQS